MAVYVPDTNTFALTDVVAAVEDHAGGISDTLSDAFAHSIDSYFDSAYKGSKNSLYNFRNYGPNGEPTQGLYNLTFPSEYDLYRLIGRLVYLSPNGANLYVHVTFMQPNQIMAYILFRYTLGVPFDFRTIQYHSQRSLGSFSGGVTPVSMFFSDDGNRLYVVSDAAIIHSGTPEVRTWVLSYNWDITNVSSYYETILNISGANRVSEGHSFIENGTVLMSYFRFASSQYIYYYNLASAYIIPSGSINPSGNFILGTAYIGNTISGFKVYDSSFSPGKIELGLNTMENYANVGTIAITKNPWSAANPYVNDYLFNTFKVADIHSSSGRLYSVFLEINVNSEDPLKPRVYFKIN